MGRAVRLLILSANLAVSTTTRVNSVEVGIRDGARNRIDRLESSAANLSADRSCCCVTELANLLPAILLTAARYYWLGTFFLKILRT